jgi:hypothetical protein
MILSTVCLPVTKLHWLFVTRKVINGLILLAITLVRILKLHYITR